MATRLSSTFLRWWRSFMPNNPVDPPADAITQDDAEAGVRYAHWKEQDPFPSIAPALLNSGDIRDYVRATGLICPFTDGAPALKPASYEVPLLGPYVYWDGEGTRREGVIGAGDQFTLQPNSIAFVTVEPVFRLPAYIALRFNLRITHVYRGLLLGTGPLVDPGFAGPLSIPLHNLTTNPYTLRGGEGLIWVEFTKLSPDRLRIDPEDDVYDRSGVVVPLEKEKLHLTVADYLHKADPHRAIRSSIPEALTTAKTAAQTAATEATSASTEARRLRRQVAVGGVIAGVVAVGAMILQGFSLVDQTNARYDRLVEAQIEGQASASEELADLQRRIEDLEEELALVRRTRSSRP